MNLRKLLGSALIVAACVAALGVHAQNLTALHPLSGYECMELNLKPQQMMDPNALVPILAKPAASSPLVGYASATVIASISPPTDGFQHVLRLDGTQGWIDSRYLKPWTNPSGNGQKCVPSVMSNGRLGFDFQ